MLSINLMSKNTVTVERIQIHDRGGKLPMFILFAIKLPSTFHARLPGSSADYYRYCFGPTSQKEKKKKKKKKGRKALGHCHSDKKLGRIVLPIRFFFKVPNKSNRPLILPTTY